MEQQDRQAILKVSKINAELRRLYEEHVLLEMKLERFENRLFLTANETMELQRLKKQKLFGVDRMMEILGVHIGSADMQAA